MRTTDIRAFASGRWREILIAVGIDVPTKKTIHAPCPICGGKDRFRFDDKESRGTWICNQCGAGDGFSLIEKSYQCDHSTAAGMVASALGHGSDPATASQIEQAKKQAAYRRADQLAREMLEAQKARGKAWEVLEICRPASPDNPYLASKQIDPCGALETSENVDVFGLAVPAGTLVIPLMKFAGGKWTLSTLQFIYGNGNKRLMKGGVATGVMNLIGEVTDSYSGEIWIAEGFATAATVNRWLAVPCIVAVSAGQLAAVGLSVREWLPDAKIMFMADNDESETGQTSAIEAAELIGASVFIPNEDHLDGN